jgi:hypothetical protein
MEHDQAGDEISHSVSPGQPGSIAVANSEKPESISDTLEPQVQSVADPSVSAVIEMVDEALKSYFQAATSEPNLTNPDEVHEAITGLKFGKFPGPNGIPNRSLEQLPSDRYPT